MSFLPYVQAGLGIFGALSSAGANREAAKAQREAARVNALRAQQLERLMRLSELYDPAAEDRAAIDYAGDVTRDNLNRGLVDLNTDWANGGGSLGDSRFRASVQGMTNRVGDPLRSMAANLASTRTMRKAQLLSQGLSAGSDIAGSFMQQSQMMQSDPSASLALLGQGLAGMPFLKGKKEQVGNDEIPRSVPPHQRPPGTGSEFGLQMPDLTKRYDTGGAPKPIRLKGLTGGLI